MSTIRLRVELLGYWHCGGGRGGGAVLDARVHRDADGLPLIPGRHLKGLLRHAVESAAAWRWTGHEGLAECLFGHRPEAAAGTLPCPGALRVSDARLPAKVASWLGGSEEGRRLLPGLFRTLHATAIDAESGSAREHSLRGIEVVVPVELIAEVSEIPGHAAPAAWRERLREILPLVTALGAHRSRGLGRARLHMEETQ